MLAELLFFGANSSRVKIKDAARLAPVTAE